MTCSVLTLKAINPLENALGCPPMVRGSQALLEVLSWRGGPVLGQIRTVTLQCSSTVAAKNPVGDYSHILTQNRPATPRSSLACLVPTVTAIDRIGNGQ
jgi:hypothetical protein